MTTNFRTHLSMLLRAMFAILATALNVNGQTTAPRGTGAIASERETSGIVGQSTTENGTSSAASTSTAAANVASMEAHGQQRLLAQCLIIYSETEAAVSEIGRQRAKHPAVKEFVDRMIKEHTEMIRKLQPSTGPDYTSRPNATHPDTNTAPQRTTNPAETLAKTGLPDAASANIGGISGGGQTLTPSELHGGLDFAELEQELATQFLASIRSELNDKQGFEFDKCFMKLQVSRHKNTLDTLKVFQKRALGELRKTIGEALPRCEAYVELAQETLKALDGTSVRGARAGE